MHSKKIVACLLVLVGLMAMPMDVHAQDLEAKLQKKLELPFIKAGNWHTDFEAAKKAAKEQGKPIFAYFTRSYAP